MKVPMLAVELELQLLACATATAKLGPSLICNLHHSSWQCRILNPLSEARDQTRILMDPSQMHFCCATTGTPLIYLFIYLFIFVFLLFLWAAPSAYGGSQARGRIGAAAAGLHHSHSHTRSKPSLQPTPQLTTMPDP